ncbi:MAG TPA: sigma-70 family RNA polymerase sigma factor [Rhizomicrobium sp.]|jgi:RNA polymerase sigma-70 factor (ECF subfamily)
MDADLTALNGLIEKLRPRLHRYCARMVGSAFDGEDVVQEALANAASAWSATIESPESWLFRIAHNAALDALRRRKRLSAFEADAELAAFADPAAIADARVSVETSLAALQALTPVERASVVLADVLGYANEEAAQILSISVAAVKAAIHRGRKRLHDAPPASATPASYSLEERDRLRAYADRFNARDFDALRDLLAEDVRLDLVNRRQLSNKKDVAIYFTRYSEIPDWRVNVGLAEGFPVLLFSNVADPSHVRFVVRIGWRGGRIAGIRDFHYAQYVMDSLPVSVL